MQRVVVYHKPGDASVLQVEERHIPKRGDGEVLIKQYSASVNPVDYKMRTSNKEHLPKVGQARFRARQLGMPDPARAYSFDSENALCMQIPGGDIAGVVEEVGPGSKVCAASDALLHVHLTW